MSITDLIWAKIPYAGNKLKTEVIALKAILEDWELIWSANAELINIFTNRAARIGQIAFSQPSTRHSESWTNAGQAKIFIVYDKSLPPVIEKTDNLNSSLGVKGEMGRVHDMAAALVFEMGNCAPALLTDIKTVRTRFYDGTISLREAGILIAGIESAGMIDCIKLMKAIPAANRPYASNRNVKKAEHATTPRQFAEVFASTPHSSKSTGGSTALTSGETYSFEAVTLATAVELEKCVKNIGSKLLGLRTLVQKQKWQDVVNDLKGRFPLTKEGSRANFYQACLGVINFMQQTSLRGVPAAVEYMFTTKMRGATSLQQITLPLSKFKPLILGLLLELGHIKNVPRDDQIRSAFLKYAYIQLT